MKKSIFSVGLPIILLLPIVSCQKSGSAKEGKGEYAESAVVTEDLTGKVIHHDISYFNFDSTDNLVSFFKDIESKHEKNAFCEEDSLAVDECILQIEKYRKGVCKSYPDSLVRQSLCSLGDAAARVDNHRPGVDLTFAEWFMMLAAYYSPDITCLVNMQSPDHLVGVCNLGQGYSSFHYWQYLLVKREKGYEVRTISDDCFPITKLYQFEDDSHRKYYLCSNNSELTFKHLLYTFDEDETLAEVKFEDEIKFPDVDFDEIYFNPESLEWVLCKRNERTGKLIPVTEKPIMKLELKGKDSKFSVIHRS